MIILRQREFGNKDNKLAKRLFESSGDLNNVGAIQAYRKNNRLPTPDGLPTVKEGILHSIGGRVDKYTGKKVNTTYVKGQSLVDKRWDRFSPVNTNINTRSFKLNGRNVANPNNLKPKTIGKLGGSQWIYDHGFNKEG